LTFGVVKQLMLRRGQNYEQAGGAPRWLNLRPRLGAISALSVMDRIAEDLRKAGPGTAIVAHLLAPHGAYIFDADCNLNPDIFSWLGAWARLPPSATNTPATRRARYLLYFDQVRCTQRKLARIFEALRDTGRFADSTIIIHGDHGSRISLLAPSNEAAEEVSRDDLIDSYSTLFALRRSDLAAGQDRRQQSISNLFAEFAMNRPLAEEPTEVFLGILKAPRAGQLYLSKPMPELEHWPPGDSSARAAAPATPGEPSQ
jgi:arylsulfatase A-like enzyme